MRGMKLNPDCIRDILLECEECCDGRAITIFRGGEPLIHNGNTYSFEELYYHLRQCDMNGYFSKTGEDMSRNFRVYDLTPKAHEFLADIRSENIWNKTKSAAKEIGVSSLHGLSSIAAQIITAIISKHLGV